MSSSTTLATPYAPAQVPVPIPAPASAAARRQLEQYILSASAAASSSSSTSASSSSSSSLTPADVATLLRQSTILTSRVDELHASVTAAPLPFASTSNTASDTHKSQALWWTAMTLLTDLNTLLSRLKACTSTDRKLGDCTAMTHQNLDIVKSLLRLLSQDSGRSDDSNPEGQAGGGGGVFNAPIESVHSSSSSSSLTRTNPVPDPETHTDFEYWRRKALSGLDEDDDDDEDDQEEDEEAGEDADEVSETESVLTDPDVHLHTAGAEKSLGGLKPSSSSVARSGASASNDADDDEGDYSEYDRPKSTTLSPPTASTTSSSSAAAAQPTSDTLLSGDRSTQEALSGELLRMASILKSNSLAFAEALERDRILLEKAGTDLGGNLDLMTRTRGKLGVYSKKVRSMGWFTLSAIGVVMLSWMLMFLVIRLT